jgi:hypothetical protein
MLGAMLQNSIFNIYSDRGCISFITASMIIIVHGSILTPSSNNWAATIGCNGGDPPAYLQFLRFLLLLPCSVLLTKNPQKVSKDESRAIFKQKQQSCQKKTLSSENILYLMVVLKQF